MATKEPKASKASKESPAPGTRGPAGGRRAAGVFETERLDGAKGRDHEVMEAAIDLFWEKGYAATSVQDVADRLGMLKGSLYYYMKGKEDLLKRIFQDSHHEGMAIIEEIRESGAAPLERLELFLTRWALWYLNNLKRTSLYAREWRHTRPDLREVLVAQRQQYDQFLTRLIEECQENGDVDASVDRRMATFYLMSAISSLPDWYNPGRTRTPEQVAGVYTAFAFRVLGRPA